MLQRQTICTQQMCKLAVGTPAVRHSTPTSFTEIEDCVSQEPCNLMLLFCWISGQKGLALPRTRLLPLQEIYFPLYFSMGCEKKTVWGCKCISLMME